SGHTIRPQRSQGFVVASGEPLTQQILIRPGGVPHWRNRQCQRKRPARASPHESKKASDVASSAIWPKSVEETKSAGSVEARGRSRFRQLRYGILDPAADWPWPGADHVWQNKKCPDGWPSAIFRRRLRPVKRSVSG